MLQINPKKFKIIQNKTFPTPLRPKFRNSNETNIYFLSKRRFEKKTKERIFKKIKILSAVFVIVLAGYLLSN
ncbi:MAG: hypothetical protein CBD13_002410 [Candidatus Pelagibacter sp. TMED153]|nr:MAG: hypothetical protein CBD13_002410 [Candidatus Pelagibacter sp. TMED153]|tara:strand:- start:592 stop:807 length:216 start_codon:yes stop_codon:yes gene_type:complete